jgi:hypothetical protein
MEASGCVAIIGLCRVILILILSFDEARSATCGTFFAREQKPAPALEIAPFTSAIAFFTRYLHGSCRICFDLTQLFHVTWRHHARTLRYQPPVISPYDKTSVTACATGFRLQFERVGLVAIQALKTTRGYYYHGMVKTFCDGCIFVRLGTLLDVAGERG